MQPSLSPKKAIDNVPRSTTRYETNKNSAAH
jgi:hypothetical protein